MRPYALAGLLPALVLAQTSTDCNPTEKTCPSDKGLDKSSYTADFTKGQDDAFKMTYGDANYDSSGVSFSISKPKEAPTMQSDFYFFFGSVSAIAKAAKGTGIVSCVILESDDLDEIDWEWLGGSDGQVQTNYYGKGNTTVYDRATYVNVNDVQDTWHNYTIEWTSSATTWFIDGAAVRTLAYADALGGKNYPQTPMKVKLGIWSASDTGAAGTIEWAGGNTDYSKAPFTMQVKSITVNNYNPASSYTYGDKTGDWQSIKMSSEGSKDSSSSESSSTKSTKTAESSSHKTKTTESDSHKTASASAKSTEKASVSHSSDTTSTVKVVHTPDVTPTKSSTAEKATSTNFASHLFSFNGQLLSSVLVAAIYQLF